MAAVRCDACDRRIRQNHHELRLTDPASGQVIGHYHARPECQQRAVEYVLEPGIVLMATFVHPDTCGPDQEFCNAGLSEPAA